MAAFVSSVSVLAWATPAVSASVIFVWLATPDGGVVDWFLTKVPPWLGGGAHWAGFSWTNAALPAYTLATAVVVWLGFPFIAVSVLAGLRTIPTELFESARVDGAGPWRIFWRVTYPLMRPIFQVLFLLSVIWDFGVFTQVFIIIGELGQRDEYNLGIYEYATAFHAAARLRPGVRAGLHPHDHPADHHGRLRAGIGPGGGAEMTTLASCDACRRLLRPLRPPSALGGGAGGC